MTRNMKRILKGNGNSLLEPLRGLDTVSGETILSDCFAFILKKGVYSKGKNLLPRGSKFFPLRVDSFSEGGLCAEKQ